LSEILICYKGNSILHHANNMPLAYRIDTLLKLLELTSFLNNFIENCFTSHHWY